MRAAAAFGVLLLLAACGSDGDPTGTIDNGSIRGTVTDNTGATVANAVIELSGNEQAVRSTNSGTDGVYTFADVPPGAYTLTVTPPTGFSIGTAGSASITVASDAQANASAFVLSRVIVNGSISGRIYDVDAEGGGVANVAIALTGNGQAARNTISGADGIYTFADLLPGTYSLSVTPPAGFTVNGGSTVSVALANGGHANAASFFMAHDSCVTVRPSFGAPATEADRALFAYDVDAPLNLQQTPLSSPAGVQLSTITYTSPDGGLVPGVMAVPVGREGLRPGIVLMHPGAMSAQGMLPYAAQLAQHGAVVIAIDAPSLRRGGTTIPTFTAIDRIEQIQLIKDLQRAVDVLIARADIDPARIGFEGYSYGGIIGAHLVGVERRLKAAVLAAAHGGHVTGATSTQNLGWLDTSTTCAQRNAWFAAMAPIEGIRFVSNAPPTALLFQIGLFDTAVLPADAQALASAASEPKDVMLYNTGHGLSPQALYDRHFWLHQQIGIDPPAPMTSDS